MIVKVSKEEKKIEKVKGVKRDALNKMKSIKLSTTLSGDLRKSIDQ